MHTEPFVEREDVKFDVVYRPESMTNLPLSQEQLARDMEGWHSLLEAITDKNSTMHLDDKNHIVLLVQEALSGAFEEFKRTLVCQCTINGGDC